MTKKAGINRYASPLNIAVGVKIHRLRSGLAMTTDELAARVIEWPETITAIEQGCYNWELELLCEIADVLGTTAEDLVMPN